MIKDLELTNTEIQERFCQIWEDLAVATELLKDTIETTHFIIFEMLKLKAARLNRTSLSKLSKRIDELAENLEGLTIHYSSTLSDIRNYAAKAKRGRVTHGYDT